MASADGGFTLVEVLVAMAVLGLAVLALLRLGTAHATTAMELEQAALGDIVAENALIDAQTQELVPAFGEESFTVANAGQTFTVRRTAERTAVDAVMLIGVEVWEEGGERIARLEGMRSTRP